MNLRHLAVAVASGALLTAGIATSAVSASAAPAAASKASLTSSTGRVVAPAAVGSETSVHGHNSYAPKGLTKPGGTNRPNSVIGTDNRYQVSNTTSFPNSAIVLIRNNGGLWCTGWLVSKDTIVSAGHCVTDGHGTWYTNLTFLPGSNGGTAPYGIYTARAIYAFTGWANGADSNYDGSIIKLNGTPGYSTGWFGTWWQTASENGLSTTVEGYPGDKPSTEWVSYDYVRNSTTDRLYYQNDTVGGESGSPIYQYRSNASYCNGYCVLGIHTNGSDGTNNSGTRFTSAKLNTIYSIANAA